VLKDASTYEIMEARNGGLKQFPRWLLGKHSAVMVRAQAEEMGVSSAPTRDRGWRSCG